MARRRHNPLQPTDEPRWAVVRNQLSQPVRYRMLAPRTDLRAALAAEREQMIAEGWEADELRWYAFCFCQKGNDRWCVAIECYEPGHAPTGHGHHIGAAKR